MTYLNKIKKQAEEAIKISGFGVCSNEDLLWLIWVLQESLQINKDLSIGFLEAGMGDTEFVNSVARLTEMLEAGPPQNQAAKGEG